MLENQTVKELTPFERGLVVVKMIAICLLLAMIATAAEIAIGRWVHDTTTANILNGIRIICLFGTSCIVFNINSHILFPKTYKL